MTTMPGMAVLMMIALAGPVDPEVIWRVDLTSDSKGSGAIADIDGDGKPEVVFGTYFGDRHIRALNGEDGSLLWKHESDRGPMDASVLIVDHDQDGDLDVLSADSSSGRLLCLDGKGKLLWAHALPNSTDSPPSVADLDEDGDLDIVAGSMWKKGGKGHVTSIDAESREVHWSKEIPGCVQSEPVLVEIDEVSGLDVVVTSWRGDRGVHALSGRTGETIWRFETAGDDDSMGMYHGVTVVGEGKKTRLIVATTEGDVYCLDRKGKEVWHEEFDEYLFAPTTATDKMVFVCGRTIRALRTRDGKEIWSRSHRQSCTRGVALADVSGDRKVDAVYATGTTLHAVDGRTGTPLAEIDLRIDPKDPGEGIAGILLSDLDGDDFIEAFCVVGRGHYGGKSKGEGNHGQAVAVRLGKGRKGEWTTFRGNNRRTGVALPTPE